MANQIISNEMPSALDLSVIKDVHGNSVTLRPHGMSGSTREVSPDAAAHEVVQRVLSSRWISIKPVGLTGPAAVAAPAQAAPVVAKTEAPEAPEVAKAEAPEAPEAPEVAKGEDAKGDDSQTKRKR